MFKSGADGADSGQLKIWHLPRIKYLNLFRCAVHGASRAALFLSNTYIGILMWF